MIVKITQKGAEAFLNSDNVLLITTGQIVNVCGVILAGGLTFEVDGTARELASKMGWKESLEL
jgi:glutamate synthase domain-containing protein 3